MPVQHANSDNDWEHPVHMTKPTNPIHAGTSPIDRDARNGRRPLCIALRLWGYEESEVQSWMSELPGLNGAITWRISRDRLARGADIVVHMVRPTRLTGDGFCWNSVGANRAVYRSEAECGTEMILFEGKAEHLPRHRAGHWAAAGTLQPHAALGRLGCLIAASSTYQPRMQAGVRRNLLGMIAQQLDAA